MGRIAADVAVLSDLLELLIAEYGEPTGGWLDQDNGSLDNTWRFKDDKVDCGAIEYYFLENIDACAYIFFGNISVCFMEQKASDTVDATLGMREPGQDERNNRIYIEYQDESHDSLSARSPEYTYVPYNMYRYVELGF